MMIRLRREHGRMRRPIRFDGQTREEKDQDHGQDELFLFGQMRHDPILADSSTDCNIDQLLGHHDDFFDRFAF